jgi:hypothetical protein
MDIFGYFSTCIEHVHYQGDKRFYKLKGVDISVPSVSSIIGATCSSDEAVSLIKAKKNWDKQFSNGEKKLTWDENSRIARDRGTECHEKLELFFREQKETYLTGDCEDEKWKMYNKTLERLYRERKRDKLIASEFFVCHSQYAGRGDLYIQDMVGSKILVDLKTSGREQSKFVYKKNKDGKTQKQYSPWFLKAIIQLSAYSMAIEEKGEIPDNLAIWLVTPTEFTTFTLKEEDLLFAREEWLRRLTKYWSTLTEVIGSEVA